MFAATGMVFFESRVASGDASSGQKMRKESVPSTSNRQVLGFGNVVRVQQFY
jgi:hypothetical protein